MTHTARTRRTKYSFQKLWQASVIPETIPRILFFGLLSLIVFFAHRSGINFAFPALGSAVPAVVLGLLLVFRTNTAYDRFWEARKLWGSQIAASRHLIQSILTATSSSDDFQTQNNKKVANLIVAFAIAMKHYLRQESIEPGLAELIGSQQYKFLVEQSHPPVIILGWLKAWVNQQFKADRISDIQLTYFLNVIDTMGFNLGGCERILSTPVPLAYSLHLSHLIYIYCFTIPFQVVDTLDWLTIPVTCLVVFALFGIEEIGVEIQNPFGYDDNDLPLDGYCNVIAKESEMMQRNFSDTSP